MSDRSKALKWWQSLSNSQQEQVVNDWKNTENETPDYRKTWPFRLISLSTNTIEIIWKETQKK